jgi:hypothetical protein
MWNYLCCPFCDFTWTFRLGGAPAKEAPGAEEDLWNLTHLFGELDKFCANVLHMPGAANDPDVRKQIDFIKASKDQLKLAQKEELVRRRTQQAQTAQFEQRYKQQEEAILKKREEVNKPAPPLDGNALGEALLKGLRLP